MSDTLEVSGGSGLLGEVTQHRASEKAFTASNGSWVVSSILPSESDKEEGWTEQWPGKTVSQRSEVSLGHKQLPMQQNKYCLNITNVD